MIKVGIIKFFNFILRLIEDTKNKNKKKKTTKN